MKKITTLLLMLFLLLPLCLPQSAYADEANQTDGENQTTDTTETVEETEAAPVLLPTDEVSTSDILLYSKACCVMDADTGRILYSKNMEERHYPASITKVLTGLLVIENSNLSDMITYNRDCWDGITSDDMHIGTLDGEQLSVEASLHAILLSSANEICNGAAISISGSVRAFCDMMNERVKSLGCTGTHFTNPNGLQNEDHYTTAHDMALIAREAIANPVFRKITGDYDYTVESTNMRPEGFVLNHKHKMLLYTKYHYNACIGGKTGYTPDANNTLVTYAEKDGLTLVCVTLDNDNGYIYDDTIMALDYCFDNYTAAAAPENGSTFSRSAYTLPALPFNGVSALLPVYVTEASSSLTLSTSEDSNALIRSFTAAASETAVAPYASPLFIYGTLDYTTEDGIYTGSDTVYTAFDHSLNDALKNHTEDMEGQEFVHLQGGSTDSTDISPSDITLKSLFKQTLSETFDWINAHKKIALPAITAAFLILTVLLVALFGIVRRMYHRKRYQKLKNKRISEH